MREMKKAASRRALDFVQSGMKLGIGTGSTAEEFIRLLSMRVAEGLDIVGVPTSKRSADLCQELHVPLTTLELCPRLDLVIDGADEIAPDLSLIKGGGGALLYEKIVAQAAQEMLVIADETKLVTTLGAFPLPVEVNIFGAAATLKRIENSLQQLEHFPKSVKRFSDKKCGENKDLEQLGEPSETKTALGFEGQIKQRMVADKPFVTDGGHYIFDLCLQKIANPQALSTALLNIAGVVEHGLFLGLASKAILATTSGEIRLIEN